MDFCEKLFILFFLAILNSLFCSSSTTLISNFTSMSPDFPITTPRTASIFSYFPSIPFYSKKESKTTEETPKFEKLTLLVTSDEDFSTPWSSTISDVQDLFVKVNETLSIIQKSSTVTSESDFEFVTNDFTSSNEFFPLYTTENLENIFGSSKINPNCLACMNNCLRMEVCRSLNDEGTTETIFNTNSEFFTSYDFETSTKSVSTPYSSSTMPTTDFTLPTGDFTHPSTSTDDADSTQTLFLKDDFIKLTQELHEIRVKYYHMEHKNSVEMKRRREVERDLEIIKIENEKLKIENEKLKIENQNLQFNLENCQNLTKNLTQKLEFLIKILETQKFKGSIVEKLEEFGVMEELKISTATTLKFTIFELETEDSHVSLVSNQKLITIPSRLVDIAPKLTEFSASSCGLEFIDGSSFEQLENLMLLNLSRNLIAKIENETFEHLKNLQTLDLSFNVIEKLESSAFFKLDNLLNLNLSNNKLSCISFELFSQLINLNSLKLSHNFITELNEIFQPINSIKEFYVNNNPLTFVDKRLIKSLERADIIDMRQNSCIDSRFPDDDPSILMLGMNVSSSCNNVKDNDEDLSE